MQIAGVFSPVAPPDADRARTAWPSATARKTGWANHGASHGQEVQAEEEVNAEKSEPSVRQVLEVIRRMVGAERAYGCGFYGQKDWIAAYNKLAAMAGMKTGYNSDEP